MSATQALYLLDSNPNRRLKVLKVVIGYSLTGTTGTQRKITRCAYLSLLDKIGVAPQCLQLAAGILCAEMDALLEMLVAMMRVCSTLPRNKELLRITHAERLRPTTWQTRPLLQPRAICSKCVRVCKNVIKMDSLTSTLPLSCSVYEFTGPNKTLRLLATNKTVKDDLASSRSLQIFSSVRGML